MSTDTNIKKRIRQLHLELAEERGLESTYCPSEVARRLNIPDWKNMMDRVREIADDLIKKDVLIVMQKGSLISGTATTAIGPIRLRKKE